MIVKFAKITSAAMLIGMLAGSTVAIGDDKGDRAADQITCKEVMSESGSNREVAIAFLHGYALGKANATSFNITELSQQTDAFINQCLDAPTAKAIDVMMKVKG